MNLMYCVKCGVELADSEARCPLCGTEVVLPKGLTRERAPSPYPPYPGAVTEGLTRCGALFIVTFLFFLPFALCLLIDWRISGGIGWSGVASGAILLLYFLVAFPFWFRRPNPVIFVPIDGAAVALYLLYLDLSTGGRWFLSLAFPTVGFFTLLLTAIVTLRRYIWGHRGYIYGGASLLTAGFSLLLEYLINTTFGISGMFHWSLYICTALFLLGAVLMVFAIVRPWRDALRKKLFF